MDTIETFWTRVDKTVPAPDYVGYSGPCWNWMGALLADGYGSFKCKRTNRFVYELCIGPIPKGLQCLHFCDNRKCVSPFHLWLGTNADNVRDKVAKGRQARGEKHGALVSAVQPRGEDAPTSKLTNEQVLEIRRLYKHGVRGSGAKVLAKQFGVRFQSIQTIVNRKTWVHL